MTEAVEPVEEVREEIANYIMSIRDHSKRPARAREGTRRRGATRLGSNQVSVTVSAGIAEHNSENIDADAVVAAADTMLYKAKQAGRNRIIH